MWDEYLCATTNEAIKKLDFFDAKVEVNNLYSLNNNFMSILKSF